MEKLFKISITLSLVFSVAVSMAQNTNYYVFKKEGTPLVKTNTTIKPLYKANAISPKMTVVLNDGDILHYINENGNLYVLEKTGTYEYQALKKYKKAENNTSVTQNYFKYVWQSINNELPEQSKGGAVLRSENQVLKSPIDDVKVIVKTVTFKWKNNDKKQNTYLFLKDKETNRIIKLGTEDNELTLFVDDYILKPNTSYQWAVSKDKTTIESDLDFQSFNITSSEEAKHYANLIRELSIELKKKGFKNKFIKKRIKEDYNIYY